MKLEMSMSVKIVEDHLRPRSFDNNLLLKFSEPNSG